MPDQPRQRDAVDDFLAANDDRLANMGAMRQRIEEILRQAQRAGAPNANEQQATMLCPLCHRNVPVQSRRIGLRTHMAIEHPAELRRMEERQREAGVMRKGPTFRCLICEQQFSDLDWYHAHIANDHHGEGQ